MAEGKSESLWIDDNGDTDMQGIARKAAHYRQDARLTDDADSIGELLDVFTSRVEAVKVVQVRKGREELLGPAHPFNRVSGVVPVILV